MFKTMFIKHQIKPLLSVGTTKLEVKFCAHICVNTDILLYFFFLGKENLKILKLHLKEINLRNSPHLSLMSPLLRMLLWDTHAHRLC